MEFTRKLQSAKDATVDKAKKALKVGAIAGAGAGAGAAAGAKAMNNHNKDEIGYLRKLVNHVVNNESNDSSDAHKDILQHISSKT